jgi:TRAP-type C4-dicarboxylate transport system permease small subunit
MVWQKIDENIEKWLIGVTYSYFCLIILIEVVRRHVFSATSVWGEMTARYAFVYLVYIAVAEVARTRDHICIDAVPRMLGPRGRLVLYLYFDLLYLVLAALVVWYSLKVMRLQLDTETLMTGFDVNMAFAHAALPLGWGLLIYRVIQRFVRTLQGYRRGHGVPAGGSGFGE